MALVDQLPFQGRHHFIKVCLCWQVETHLDPEVSDALALWDPLEADLLAPSLGAFLPARPDGGGFVPVYVGTERLAKDCQDSLSSVQVSWISLEVKGCVVGKCLVSDPTSSRQDQAFNLVPGVFQHVPQDISR